MKGSNKGKSAKTVLYIAIIDLVFFLLLGGSFYLLNAALLENFSALEDVYPTLEKVSDYFYQGETPASSEAFTAELENAKSVLFNVIVGFVLSLVVYFVVFVAVLSFLKGLIWAKVSDQRFSFRFFRKFLVFNYLWLGFWALVMGVSFVITKLNIRFYIVGVEFLLFVYSTLVVLSGFRADRGVFKSLGGIKACFCGKAALSFVYVLLGFVVLALVCYLLFLVVKGGVFVLIALVLFSLYAAFVRRYMSASLLKG